MVRALNQPLIFFSTVLLSTLNNIDSKIFSFNKNSALRWYLVWYRIYTKKDLLQHSNELFTIDIVYLLTSERRQLAFFRTTLVFAIFGHFLLILEKKTKFIKFCIKFHVKQGKILPSNCTKLLLGSKPVQRNGLHFFRFFKRQCAL